MTLAWWSFLSHVDIDFLMEMYRDAIPRKVKLVLGNQVIETSDLLGLEVENGWKTSKWGVYLDLLTKSTDLSWVRRYVGSATRLCTDKCKVGGLWVRIKTYFTWFRYDRNNIPKSYYKAGGGSLQSNDGTRCDDTSYRYC